MDKVNGIDDNTIMSRSSLQLNQIEKRPEPGTSSLRGFGRDSWEPAFLYFIG